MTLAAFGGLVMTFVIAVGPSKTTGPSPQYVTSALLPGEPRPVPTTSRHGALTVETTAEFEPMASHRKSRRVRPLQAPAQVDKATAPGEKVEPSPSANKEAEVPSSPVRTVTPAERNEPQKEPQKELPQETTKPGPLRESTANAEVPPAEAPKGLPVTGEEPAKTVWSDAEIITALRQCLSLLTPLNVEILPADPVRNGACGDAAPVKVRSIGKSEKVVFEPPVEVNCELAARLATWVETSLQPAARQMLSSPVAKIQGASGYSCRNRYGLPDAPLSEHATGNAVDIPAFVLANGKSVRVAAAWGPTARDLAALKVAVSAAAASAAEAVPPKQAAPNLDAAAKTAQQEAAKGAAAPQERKGKDKLKVVAELKGVPMQKLGAGGPVPVLPAAAMSDAAAAAKSSPEGVFLRRLAKEACQTFGTVLGPEANEAHRDHFHLDIKARRKKAYCE
jgi:hypothetical protein